ncbi:MAG: S8 family serine peptidase [Gammaproteobacteria bacterium]
MIRSVFPRLLPALICLAATHAGASNTDRYLVRLELPSVAQMHIAQTRTTGRAPARSAQRAHTRQVQRQQDQMSRTLAPVITRELGRLDTALNGIKVLATPDQVAAIRATKGVLDVTRIEQHEIDNAASVAWIGAPQVWETFGDASDITIAIIDTGIDYLHANFGGAGDPDEYAANDKSLIEAGSFPTAKVIGGWDFAGPTYNSRVDDFPQPDPDPLDGNGHGSHVAGSAAGVGVPERIGPGVAKGAKLLALKVFSDEGGSTDLTADAIDYALDPNGDGAIDDRVDVINMSLGARFGDQNDPSALASTIAVQAGVIVVASAGNNGDNPYVTGSPGVSPEVITVGATIAGDRPQIALRVLSDDTTLAGLYRAAQGSGAVRVVDAPVTAPLAISRAPVIDEDGLVVTGEFDDRACADLVNAAEVAHHVVLVSRGGCSYEEKYANVEQAGGLAVLAYNDGASDAPFIMGGIGASGKEFALPGMMISGSDAQRLIDALGATEFRVQFAASNTVPGLGDNNDQLTLFTSRGPANGGAQFKPDLSAPGRFIMSTAAGTGFKARQLRGTSMAAPHVAGAAALMRQRHPDLPVAAIKALLQNATVQSDEDGPGSDTPAPLTRQGLGVVRVNQAIALTSYAAPAGVSFGYAMLNADEQQMRPIELVNLSDQARVFSVTHTPRGLVDGMSASCPETVAVPANGRTRFNIALSVTAALLPTENGRLDHGELDGWCELSDGIDTLRVGYLASREPAAAIAFSPSAQGITVSNTGVAAGRASGFHLLGVGGTRDATRTIAAVGFRNATTLGLPVFHLAVALNEAWETPAHVTVEMLIDTDLNGSYERALWAGDWSQLRFDPGTYVTGVFDVIDNERPNFVSGYTDWFSEDVDFNDQVMMLPFSLLPQFGLSFIKPEVRQFGYLLRVTSRDGSYDQSSGMVDLDAFNVTDEADSMIAPDSVRNWSFDNDRPTLWLMPGNPIGQQFQVFDAPVRNRGAKRRR